MHAIGTQDRTYCTRIIIDIPQKKQGVAATLAYLYVGPTYVNVVVAKILHRYYFTINMPVYRIHTTRSSNIERRRIYQQKVSSLDRELILN